VTAPGSGAETIPFLKTWVNLPMAIGFTVLYSKVRPPLHCRPPSPARCSGADLPAPLCLRAEPPRPAQAPELQAAACCPLVTRLSLLAGRSAEACASVLSSQAAACRPHDLGRPAAQLANILSTEQLFYACIIPFIMFFGAFAFIMYPLRDTIHPHGAPACIPPFVSFFGAPAFILNRLRKTTHPHACSAPAAQSVGRPQNRSLTGGPRPQRWRTGCTRARACASPGRSPSCATGASACSTSWRSSGARSSSPCCSGALPTRRALSPLAPAPAAPCRMRPDVLPSLRGRRARALPLPPAASGSLTKAKGILMNP